MKRNAGQALLLVLLSMAVVLTIVLSIVSRSITDISVSTREEEALRAFSAAEAGIEQSLVVGTSVGQTQIGDASFATNVTSAASGGKEFSYPIELSSGESVVTWFVAHDASGNLVCNAGNPCFTGSTVKFCWGKAGTSSNSTTTPAIEASIFYTTVPGDYSTARIARETADPNGARRATNSFSSADAGTCQVEGTTYQFQKTINFPPIGILPAVYNSQNGLQYAVVRMFYNTDVSHLVGTSVNFPGTSNLPPQGLKLESLGTSGEATRKIEVFQGYGEVPPLFGGVLFSTSGITK